MSTFAGIEKAIEDEGTGVEASFWALSQYTVRLQSGTTQAVLRGYASRQAFNSGKKAFAHKAADLPGRLTDDDEIFAALVAQEGGVFEGGELVESAPEA